MVWGERGRQGPPGKLASNPSITDLSYTSSADMSRRKRCVDMCCYYPQPQASIM